MDDRSLDFLDQLVPGSAKPDADSAPSMRKGQGRSLPPPPPAVVTASQQPKADIDIDVDLESKPVNEVPLAPSASNRVPMPEGRSRSERPPATLGSRPPPPPWGRPAAASAGPPRPPRPSTGPAALRASAAPPPPPRPPSRAPSPLDALAEEMAEEIDEVEAVEDLDDVSPAEISAVTAGSGLGPELLPAPGPPLPGPNPLDLAAPSPAGLTPATVSALPEAEALPTEPSSASSFSSTGPSSVSETLDEVFGAVRSLQRPDGSDAAFAQPAPSASAAPPAASAVEATASPVNDVSPPAASGAHRAPDVAADSSSSFGVNPGDISAAAGPEPTSTDAEQPEDEAPTSVFNNPPDEPAQDEHEDEEPTGVGHAAPAPPSFVAPSVAPGVTFSPGTSAPPALPTTGLASSLPPLPPPPSSSATSLPPPPLPAAVPASASEWDEAPTTVYTRDSLQPSQPPVAAGATLPPMAAARTVPAIRAPRVTNLQAPSANKNRLYIAGAAAAAAVLALVVIPFGPAEGELVINVAGTDGLAVDGVRVYLDDKLVCEDSPCQVGEIEAIGHVVTAEAEGYNKTAAMAVLVKPDDTTIHNVELVQAKTNTGVSIPKAPGEKIELAVDGRALGKLPLRLDDLEPGKHTLTFTGGERYGTLERTVDLEEGQVLAMESIKLPVVKGIAKFSGDEHTDGAEITLDGKAITLPHSAELSGKKAHRVVATREGFRTFEREFEFDPGEPELSIEVALVPESSVAEIDADEGAEAEVATASASTAKSSKAKSSKVKPSKTTKTTRSVSTTKSSAKASGSGKLTLLSVPSSTVIVDGRPVGKTPKRAISVSAGTHSVVFVHPTKGRKRASAKVTPGGSKTVAVRF